MLMLALLLASLGVSPGDTYELVATVTHGTDTITVSRGYHDHDSCSASLVYLAQQKQIVGAYCVALPDAT